jgi:hypothetical protein
VGRSAGTVSFHFLAELWKEMAVDHGLGGKDSQRSREKREKRAQKQKAYAHKALTGGNKKELKFDENSRVEWLTGQPTIASNAPKFVIFTICSGFRKRKTERRKFGLTKKVFPDVSSRVTPVYTHNNQFCQIEKEKQALKDARKERRKSQASAAAEIIKANKNSADDSSVQSEAVEKLKENFQFEDSYTRKLFGADVSITVNEGICFDD